MKSSFAGILLLSLPVVLVAGTAHAVPAQGTTGTAAPTSSTERTHNATTSAPGRARIG